MKISNDLVPIECLRFFHLYTGFLLSQVLYLIHHSLDRFKVNLMVAPPL